MDEWKPKTFNDMLDHVCERFAKKDAIIFEDQRITYEELRTRAVGYARAFLGLGLQKDDKVSIWMNNCPEWIYIQLAVGMIGAVLVPVNTRFKIKELEYTLKQSDSRVLITMDRFLSIDFAGLVYETIPGLKEAGAGPHHFKDFPRLEYVICKGPEEMPGMVSLTSFLAKGSESSKDAVSARQETVDPDDVVMFQYTSGTTSFPKGVMLTHDGTLRDSFCMGSRMTIDEADRLFCPLPFFHVGGAVISTLLTFQKGAALVICDTYSPETALRIVESAGCTAMTGIETHFLMMYSHNDFAKYDLSKLQKGWAIGQPQIIRAIYEKMGMRKIANVYGISEASPNVTTTDVNDPLEHRMYWHGKPHSGTEIKIVDYETGKRKPPGQEGELCVRGWNVMKGYYNKPEETKAAIDDDGWLHTGDSGMMDDKGNLKFMGRIKDIVRVGGENVSAMEVEDFLLSNPLIENVAIIAAHDERLTEVCMAVVQLKEGHTATEEEIIDFCKGKIANFKIPRYVRFVDEFPMTGSGKIQKFVLKERFGL